MDTLNTLWSTLQVTPETLLSALMAALGTALVLSAVNWGGFSRIGQHLVQGAYARMRRREMLDLGPAKPADGPESQLLIERAIAPLVQLLSNRDGPQGRRKLERDLTILGFPSPYGSVADVYALRVFFALAGFGVGLIMAYTISRMWAPAWVVIPLALAAAGFIAVPQDLRARLARRERHVLFEMPYAIDRLIVAKLTLSSVDALIEAVSTWKDGGYVLRELRMVAEDYGARKVSLTEAFGTMMQRNVHSPLLERLADRLIQAHTDGSDLVPTLEVLGARARAIVESQIKETGEQNRTIMIGPTIIGLVGTMVAITAPSFATFTALFSNAGP